MAWPPCTMPAEAAPKQEEDPLQHTDSISEPLQLGPPGQEGTDGWGETRDGLGFSLLWLGFPSSPHCCPQVALILCRRQFWGTALCHHKLGGSRETCRNENACLNENGCSWTPGDCWLSSGQILSGASLEVGEQDVVMKGTGHRHQGSFRLLLPVAVPALAGSPCLD